MCCNRIPLSKSFLVICTLILLLLSVTTVSAQSVAPYRVGVILPLTGDVASYGIAAKNGIELGLSELSPEVRAKIKLQYDDDGFSPNRSVASFQKMLTVGGLDLLINLGSSTSKALVPATEARRLPFIAIASDTNVSAGRKYAMNFWVTPREELRALLPEMQRRGVKKIARIGTQHEFTEAVLRDWKTVIGDTFTIVHDQQFAPDVRDFKSWIAKVKNEPNVDGIVVVVFPGQLGIFAKQLREGGVIAPMYGVEVFEEPSEVKVSGGALVDQIYANYASPSGDFLKKYQEKYPGEGMMGAANGHDVVLMIGEAIKAGVAPDKLNDYFHNIKNFSGSMGTYSAQSDNTFDLPAELKIVRKDGFEPLYKK